MSTELAETETDDGVLNLTQFSGGSERGVMVQITGPNIHEPERAHWITLRPKDAAWLAARLSAWAQARGEE